MKFQSVFARFFVNFEKFRKHELSCLKFSFLRLSGMITWSGCKVPVALVMHQLQWNEEVQWFWWEDVSRADRNHAPSLRERWLEFELGVAQRSAILIEKTPMWNITPEFLFCMTSSGIEPEFTPWEGVVLTAWPWGHDRYYVVSLDSFLWVTCHQRTPIFYRVCCKKASGNFTFFYKWQNS